jgi:NADP-dependent 3-hydroxy acid dehydrogenase YdfG
MTAKTSGNKIAVITGAASGICAATCRRLGEDGVAFITGVMLPVDGGTTVAR